MTTKSRTQLAAVWPPTSDVVREADHRPQSPLHAIRAKCLDCACYQVSEVRLCEAVKCPLWPFRATACLQPCAAASPSTCNTSAPSTCNTSAAAGHRRLSNGQTIHAAVAAIIINNKSVEPANDGLFPDLLAQTGRMK